jgi:hypothetical protein
MKGLTTVVEHSTVAERAVTTPWVNLSYDRLRAIVGYTAVLLPVVVAGLGRLRESAWRSSISSYYYAWTGSWFVGSLFVLALFFVTYGYGTDRNAVDPELGVLRRDFWITNLASLAALVVAVVPTPSNGRRATGASDRVGQIHLGAAALLFVLLAVMALRFMQANENSASAGKAQRKAVYAGSAFVILAAIAWCVVAHFAKWSILVPEILAVVAFGVSWLVKGGLILRPR